MGDREKDRLASAENREQEARFDELTTRFTEAVLGLVGERVGGDLRTAIQDAGFSQRYAYRLKNGERTMSLDLAAKLLEMNGIPVAALARRLLDQESGEPAPMPFEAAPPAKLLAALREKGGERKSPFLAKLSPLLGQIAGRQLVELRKPPTWRATLMVLEEERQRDWRKTRQRLERFTLLLGRRLAGQQLVSRNDLVELATLIAAWSAIQRVAGLRGWAFDALETAFRLAERSADIWALGFCLQKAAYLAQDLGHDKLALALVERAALCYAEAGTADELARILIDRGCFSYSCGKQDDALRLLETGLRKVDRNQRLYVVAAHLALARIHRERGDRSRARQELRAAIECHLADSVEVAYISWEAAKQEREFAEMAAAEDLLRDSLRIFAQHGRGGDLALVALDYAGILVESGRLDEMKPLIRDVLKWLEPMAQSGRGLVRPFQNLSARLALGTLGSAELDDARQCCERVLARRAS